MENLLKYAKKYSVFDLKTFVRKKLGLHDFSTVERGSDKQLFPFQKLNLKVIGIWQSFPWTKV
jgi:hypothetical protein